MKQQFLPTAKFSFDVIGSYTSGFGCFIRTSARTAKEVSTFNYVIATLCNFF
jgi:hypothetical protein